MQISRNQVSRWIPWIIAIFLAISIGIWLYRSSSKTPAPQKAVYLIGRDSSWYPVELLGRDRNLSAFTNDLMAHIAKEAGLRFQWVETSPNILFSGLDNRTYDAIISSMQFNLFNQQRYVLSDPLFKLGPVLIVPINSPINSLKEIQGLTIGTRSGSLLAFNAIQDPGNNLYNFGIVSYENINKALEALFINRIDGVIWESLPAYTLTEGFYAGELKIVTPPLTNQGIRIIALKSADSTLLIETINKTLIKLKEDGSYDSLIEKWDLINPEKNFWQENSQ